MIELKPSAATLRAVVLYHTHNTLKQWKAGTKHPKTVRGKRVMCVICRDHLGMSYPETARVCGYNSHASAYDGYRRAKRDPDIIETAETIYRGAYATD